MHELHDHCAFADTGSDALHGTVAHIAHNKNSWHVGFEQTRVAIQRPGGWSLSAAEEVWTGKNEPAFIALDCLTEPFRPRLRADENEQARGGEFTSLSRGSALDRNPGEPRFSFDRYHARPRPHLDVCCLFDLLDQVVRHRGGERHSAHQHQHFLRKLRKVHGGLTGGIRAANDVDCFALAGQRFGGSAAIINTGALQVLNPRNVQGLPLHAHGEKQSVTRNLRTVRKLHIAVRTLGAKTSRFLWRENLDAEAPRLCNGTPRQVTAAKSGWKAEIVLNSRTKSGLSARRFAFDHHRSQAFARTIYSGGKPRRSSSDDGEIVEVG